MRVIKEMQLTPTSMIEIAQKRGFGRGIAGGTGGAGGFRPPAGVTPPGGSGRGGGFGPGGAFGAGGNLSPEEQEAAMAERMNAQMGTAMSGMLISLLEARAKGETLEMASPDQRIGNMGAVLGVVAEAIGLDQREIVSQAREGKTLAEIIEANGADVDEILAQVVATETERGN